MFLIEKKHFSTFLFYFYSKWLQKIVMIIEKTIFFIFQTKWQFASKALDASSNICFLGATISTSSSFYFYRQMHFIVKIRQFLVLA